MNDARRRRGHQTLGSAGLAAAAVLLFAGPALSAQQDVQLRVLSSRPDMVTGGDALLEVRVAPGLETLPLQLTLNGRDLSKALRPGRGAGVMIGRIEGLAIGRNMVEGRISGRPSSKLELTNHPVTGPVFSGPHQTPFICQTELNAMGPALDGDCSARTVVTYMYRTTQPFEEALSERGVAETVGYPGARRRPTGAETPLGFKPYDPTAPRPKDLAVTTTTAGETVDYIVRRELGTINRAIYEIDILHKPGDPLPDPWTAPKGWNGRLVYAFGGGCSSGYRQGALSQERDAGGLVASEEYIGQGYALARSTLNVFGNGCNDVLSAETAMMVKEHFIEQFGPPVHTIGRGVSGGGVSVYAIASNYPGILDGITPTQAYPDLATLAASGMDCPLLDRAIRDSKLGWTFEQMTAVAGFSTYDACTANWRNFAPAWVVATSCDRALPKSLVYDRRRNPKGVRCDIYSDQANMYGRDRETGFARRPLDNVGVQYGLVAFNAGKISAAQFVDLNARVGGYDRDGAFVPERTEADRETLAAAYRSGRVVQGGAGLAETPILQVHYYTELTPDHHDLARAFSVRDRLKAANAAGNQVIVISDPDRDGAFPYRKLKSQIVQRMDAWLDNIARDVSRDPRAVKIARNRPADLQDACYTQDRRKVVDFAKCNDMYPHYGNPRIAAGAPLRDDILKCALKPIDPADYARPLADEQLNRLRVIFPKGVCDWSKPGIGQQPAVVWKSYAQPRARRSD